MAKSIRNSAKLKRLLDQHTDLKEQEEDLARQREKVRRSIKKLLDEADRVPACFPVETDAGEYEVLWAQRKEYTIDNAAVMRLVGPKVFRRIAKVAICTLKELLSPEEIEEVVTSEPKGQKTLTVRRPGSAQKGKWDG